MHKKSRRRSAATPSIVLVIGALDCGGAQRIMVELANFWASCGWRVTLATWSGPTLADFYAVSPGVKRIWLEVPAGALPGLRGLARLCRRVGKLRRLLRDSGADAVLSFIDVSNVHTILAATGMDLQVVIAERTHPALNRTVPMVWRVLRRLCYRRADRVVVQTRDVAAWIERKCRTSAVIIPNFLRQMPDPAPGPRKPLILAVGRLTEEKGFDLLLRAFARLRGRFAQWSLCILGEGPQRPALARLAAELDLGDSFRLVGESRDVDSWLARTSLMVHPSRREGFPNAVLEAMAMGAAVICTDCRSGPAELIEDRLNGRLVPVDDLDCLVRAMEQLMSDEDLRSRLGKEALGVRQRFSRRELLDDWSRCLLPGVSSD